MFTLNGNYKWSTSCRVSYQITTHKYRIIGMRFADVTSVIVERFLDTVYSAIKIAGLAKFRVGVYI